RLPRALNPNENPAQFGIFFSANRLIDFIGKAPAGFTDRPDAASPRWISDNDYSLRVEYGARGFGTLSECTRGAPIPPYEGPPILWPVFDTPLPRQKDTPAPFSPGHPKGIGAVLLGRGGLEIDRGKGGRLGRWRRRQIAVSEEWGDIYVPL
ncbi:MAG: hypothetical protein BECKG1743D_GA0114223_110621, partial [Candidatus Kentron sp. G]